MASSDVCTGQDAKFGHETLSCYATKPHPGQPHMAIVCPPCPRCGGFDEHTAECPTPFVVSESEAEPYVYVLWNDEVERPEIADQQYWRTWRELYRA